MNELHTMRYNKGKGCEEDEYAASDATESCVRLRSSAEEPWEMTSEPLAETVRSTSGARGRVLVAQERT
jgi:hypothetical protein